MPIDQFLLLCLHLKGLEPHGMGDSQHRHATDRSDQDNKKERIAATLGSGPGRQQQFFGNHVRDLSRKQWQSQSGGKSTGKRTSQNNATRLEKEKREVADAARIAPSLQYGQLLQLLQSLVMRAAGSLLP